MLDEDSVRRLRCPVTLGKLTLADEPLIDRVNRLIDEGRASTRGGEQQKERVQGGLVTDDRKHLYTIQGGIVCMLADSAIVLEFVNDAAE